MTNVFVYGTLLVPAMMETVVGRRLESTLATLQGYCRSGLTGCYYPGIVPAVGTQVAGLVYHGVEDQELERLDFFEGPEYQRQTVQLVGQGDQPVAADTYVLAPAEQSRLTGVDWDVEPFRTQHLEEFLEVARQTMRRYSTGDSSVRPPRLD